MVQADLLQFSGLPCMWDWPSETLNTNTLRFRPGRHGQRLAWREVLSQWQENAEFRSEFVSTLAAAPFRCFRWETPAVSAKALEREFEFVIVDSPELDTEPDPSPFSEHFGNAAGDSVIRFANLGGDAELVVPCPVGPASAYTHLAAFVCDAPATQQHELWRAVGRAMSERIGRRPVWLNTAGGGVAWLHVRLDDRPKYYAHAPYRTGAPDRPG